MRRALSLALVLAAASAFGLGAAAQPPSGADAVDLEHMTGAEPITPAEYATLPKIGHHRAWLPKSVDLTADYPAPGTQGAQPNCVAWATTYSARSYLYGKQIGHRLDQNESMSAAYVYNRLRPPGSICWGSVKMVDALNFLKSEGTVPVADFPDDMLKCKIPAAVTLKEKASAFKLDDWRAIDRELPNDWRTPLVIDDVKGALARGVPVVFAMPASPDFIAFKGNGVYANPENYGRNLHAMALVGYDEDRQAFRMINSWGPRWGDGGYAWIAYDTFKRNTGEAYALEAPTVHPAGPAPNPQVVLDTETSTFQCGSVQVAKSPDGLVVTGFGGVQDSLDRLHAAANAVSLKVDWHVAYHPWPQCEAETTLAQPLHGTGVSLLVETEAGATRTGDPVAMQAGEKFGIAAEASAAKPYLSVIYLQADGSAVELYRGQPAADASGKRQVVLGTGGPRSVRFEVAPPYGNEVLIALASAAPLFGAELETYATERQFLTALRAHLLSAPRDSVSAAVLRLKTSE